MQGRLHCHFEILNWRSCTRSVSSGRAVARSTTNGRNDGTRILVSNGDRRRARYLRDPSKRSSSLADTPADGERERGDVGGKEAKATYPSKPRTPNGKLWWWILRVQYMRHLRTLSPPCIPGCANRYHQRIPGAADPLGARRRIVVIHYPALKRQQPRRSSPTTRASVIQPFERVQTATGHSKRD
jgi:hypothetical protein